LIFVSNWKLLRDKSLINFTISEGIALISLFNKNRYPPARNKCGIHFPELRINASSANVNSGESPVGLKSRKNN
jgi:hypothetical protein